MPRPPGCESSTLSAPPRSAGTAAIQSAASGRAKKDDRRTMRDGSSAKSINKYKNWVFEISTPAGVRRVKVRADRNSGGAVKWLELLAAADQPTCRARSAETNQDKDPPCVQLYSGRVRSSSARLRSR